MKYGKKITSVYASTNTKYTLRQLLASSDKQKANESPVMEMYEDGKLIGMVCMNEIAHIAKKRGNEFGE